MSNVGTTKIRYWVSRWKWPSQSTIRRILRDNPELGIPTKFKISPFKKVLAAQYGLELDQVELAMRGILDMKDKKKVNRKNTLKRKPLVPITSRDEAMRLAREVLSTPICLSSDDLRKAVEGYDQHQKTKSPLDDLRIDDLRMVISLERRVMILEDNFKVAAIIGLILLIIIASALILLLP